MEKGFEDLDVYQEARRFRGRVWALTKLLPPGERYVLGSQMRKASLLVTNCVAEGHGSRSHRQNRGYLYRARGGMCELQDDLNACEDESYFEKKHLDDLREHSVRVVKLINGYISYLTERISEEDKAAKREPLKPPNHSTTQPVNESTSEPVNE